jgi:hypothetical protein
MVHLIGSAAVCRVLAGDTISYWTDLRAAVGARVNVHGGVRMNVHSAAQMDGGTSGDTSDGSTAHEPTSGPSETYKNGRRPS